MEKSNDTLIKLISTNQLRRRSQREFKDINVKIILEV